jgi:hypothetical protein
VRRPSTTQEALRLTPLVETGWADASRVKGVPLVAAGAKPFIFLAGRPPAKWAADTRVGGFVTLLLLKLAILNDGRIGNVIQETLGTRILHVELVLEQLFRIILLLEPKKLATPRVCRPKLFD